MDLKLALEWGIFLLGLAALLYTMITIKREKLDLATSSAEFAYENLSLFIPHWWARKEKAGNVLEFYRADTRYDWISTFTWAKTPLPLQDFARTHFESINLILDESIVVEIDARVLIRSEAVRNQITEFFRIEGTGTQDETERLYYDLCLIKFNDGKILFCESRSSVLNGLVEGPFFEEVIASIELKNELPIL